MTPTEYISRESVKAILKKYNIGLGGLLGQDIKALPSLPDKSIQIREMVEKCIEHERNIQELSTVPAFRDLGIYGETRFRQLLTEIDTITG